MTVKLGDCGQIAETLARIDAEKQAAADQPAWDMFFCTAMQIVFNDIHAKLEESSIAITVAAEFADVMLYERNSRRAR